MPSALTWRTVRLIVGLYQPCVNLSVTGLQIFQILYYSLILKGNSHNLWLFRLLFIIEAMLMKMASCLL